MATDDTEVLQPQQTHRRSESVSPRESGSKSASLRDYVLLLRPSQWIKNVVVFAGPAAGLKLTALGSLAHALIAFAAFSLTASATYSINDILDAEADASHPTKRFRPIASGAIRPGTAAVLALILVSAGLALTWFMLPRGVTAVLCAYFLMTLAYSSFLKNQVILDVIVIATGFVLRAWAGALAVGVIASDWLIACVFTLCLFMGFGKRRCELAMIGNLDQASHHRQTLVRYTPNLLTHLITVSAGIAVITFLLYTLDTDSRMSQFQKHDLFYTLPLVVYGIFRFAMRSELGIHSGPTDIVLKDRALLVTILLWAAIALCIVYQNRLVEGGFDRWFESAPGYRH